MLFSDKKLAGLLAFVGGVECILGISIAEELYPGYSVSSNYISDLGATCRSGSCNIVQPSSIIFNSSVALLGALVITGSFFLYRSARERNLTILLVLSGIGALGVGFFPETTGVIHATVSLIVFLFGGLSAVASFRIQEVPMRYLSIGLGAITLLSLGLFLNGTYLGLDKGGMERMIAYPALLWLVGFGADLMRSRDMIESRSGFVSGSRSV